MSSSQKYSLRPLGLKKVHLAAVGLLILTGCQTVPPEEETVETVETTVYIERQDPNQVAAGNSQVIVVEEKKRSAPPQPQKTLSILKVTTGQGCPSRDPNTYGVFLKSEKAEDGLLCYYD